MLDGRGLDTKAMMPVGVRRVGQIDQPVAHLLKPATSCKAAGPPPAGATHCWAAPWSLWSRSPFWARQATWGDGKPRGNRPSRWRAASRPMRSWRGINQKPRNRLDRHRVAGAERAARYGSGRPARLRRGALAADGHRAATRARVVSTARGQIRRQGHRNGPGDRVRRRRPHDSRQQRTLRDRTVGYRDERARAARSQPVSSTSVAHTSIAASSAASAWRVLDVFGTGLNALIGRAP